MKKAIVICVCMACAGFSSAFIVGRDQPSGVLGTYDDIDYMLLNLTSVSSEQLEDFFKGETVNLVLECPEGTSLPFNLSLKGDFLSLQPKDEPPYSLKILKTCFIRHFRDLFLFSDDCVQWKEFQDFFTGSLSFSLAEELSAQVTLTLNPKA